VPDGTVREHLQAAAVTAAVAAAAVVMTVVAAAAIVVVVVPAAALVAAATAAEAVDASLPIGSREGTCCRIQALICQQEMLEQTEFVVLSKQAHQQFD